MLSQLVSRSPFLQACRGQVPEVTPIWLMRQAGRILKPYRELREKYRSLEPLFTTPELAAEITLMPIRLLEVDAAILFTDLVTPLVPMGCSCHYRPGPVLARPVRTRKEVEKLRPVCVETDLAFVLESIRLVRRELPPDIPLIGYAGAPFTLASWAVEGKSSRDFSTFRRLLYADPETAHLLLDKVTQVIADFLVAQIRSGAQAIQLFDTSVGILSPTDFQRFALPYLQRLFAALASEQVPRLYFPLASDHLLLWLGQIGADVLSLDWRTDLAQAFASFPELALQGNLDPCALFAPAEELVAQAQAILRVARGHPHIFNLGHGVLPETPFDQVRRLVDAVHNFSG